MDVIYAELRTIFSEVFDDDSIDVTPELSAADVPDWDSLTHIRLIVAVQRAFSISFSAAQIANLKNVGELASLIDSRIPGS